MKFSERKGYKPLPTIIQREFISDELRITLWNYLQIILWDKRGFLNNEYGNNGEIQRFSSLLWYDLKKPIDTLPELSHRILSEIRKYYFQAAWYEAYDFIDFTLNYLNKEENYIYVNNILEKELSGYRFVNRVLTDITSKEEIEAIEQAMSTDEYPGVKNHLQRALELLSDKIKPDYRNSIKESISAVESIAREITGVPKATLGDALKILEKNNKLHTALKDGFSKIYGYTSDKGGIRHAMLEEPNIDLADARFFLIACSSFINYLKSKK